MPQLSLVRSRPQLRVVSTRIPGAPWVVGVIPRTAALTQEQLDANRRTEVESEARGYGSSTRWRDLPDVPA